MANISLEDTKGIIETIVFPDLYSKQLLLIKSDKPIVVTGTLERTEDGTSRIRAKNITPLEDVQEELDKIVRIRIDCTLFKKDYLRTLRDILASIKGDSRSPWNSSRTARGRYSMSPACALTRPRL